MFKITLYLLLCIKYFPFLLLYFAKQNSQIKDDIHHYSTYFGFRKNYYFTLVYLLEKIPEFRNIFYFRYPCSFFIKPFFKGVDSLYFFIDNKSVGGGLLLWHGFSTVINAVSIGENCEIWQNVTIGKKSTQNIPDKPTIGNNVKICAHSVVIGPIKIGDNVIIGAGTVVNKNIPNDSIVVGNPARIIKK